MNGSPFLFSFDALGLRALMPAIALALAGLALILLDAVVPRLRAAFAPLAALSLLLIFYFQGRSVTHGMFFQGTIESSALTQYLHTLFFLVAIVVILMAQQYLQREGIEMGEFYALVLWATAGMMLMVQGHDLLVIFVGLELLSVSLYVLAGYHRGAAHAAEAALKYFIMGSFASGFILYGVALLYGKTGTTNLTTLHILAAGGEFEVDAVLSLAVVFMLAGFAFKLALFPFHAWAPDVYQGAASPVAAFFTVAPKAASLIVLMRVVGTVFRLPVPGDWSVILAALAVASMTIGNLVALAQRDIKRMLAYSGIAHMGYALLALPAVLPHRTGAEASVLIYIATYAFMNLGAFAVICIVYKGENEPHLIQTLSGLARRNPFLGFALAVFMVSLGGIPATAGFIGKFFVFKTAIQGGYLWLAIAGILNSLVSLGYYLRVVYVIYMNEPIPTSRPAGAAVPGLLEPGIPPLAEVTPSAFSMAAVALSLACVFLFGLFPGPLVHWANIAATSFLPH